MVLPHVFRRRSRWYHAGTSRLQQLQCEENRNATEAFACSQSMALRNLLAQSRELELHRRAMPPFFLDSICSCTSDLHVSQRTLDSILRTTRFRRDEPAHLCHFFTETNQRIVFCAASLRLFTVFWHLRHDFIQTRQPYLGEIPWRPIMPNNKCL